MSKNIRKISKLSTNLLTFSRRIPPIILNNCFPCCTFKLGEVAWHGKSLGPKKSLALASPWQSHVKSLSHSPTYHSSLSLAGKLSKMPIFLGCKLKFGYLCKQKTNFNLVKAKTGAKGLESPKNGSRPQQTHRIRPDPDLDGFRRT